MPSIAAAVSAAAAYLVGPLQATYAVPTVGKLRLVLEANLTAHYAREVGSEPLKLSPSCLPPRVIYAACIAAGVQWFDWIAVLGGRELELFVTPSCVSVRVDHKQHFTIWSSEAPRRPAPIQPTPFSYSGKTLAQQLLEEDAESDEQIFAMISGELDAPTWKTPVRAEFHTDRSLSPLSSISRCSSRSSNSSSGSSFSSIESIPSRRSLDDDSRPKQSRRERARQARVFVDTSKTEVTPYDGGKTTVLTGGVMLGGAAPKRSAPAFAPIYSTRPPLRI